MEKLFKGDTLKGKRRNNFRQRNTPVSLNASDVNGYKPSGARGSGRKVSICPVGRREKKKVNRAA